ncbi:hypothetical protein BOW53_01855 [Solemya pervernicosa gill symbiont]|uniref:Dynamin N-terminal domain-containing protein n=2 Tax=Gammaproteobacteria incertae sedis TaxID=118884 RepID=A0A1T2LA03_9GAMM|nr:dynamin family protein [Candidatus Reidiella endopervernicosa]OOZ41938.1 hypothetical protein BOW53_01855 [Solemya pervernicosa gill symbiont]QKQ24904.1 dynamin family protein [Candidatus Reidiella endopervernicosa]
MATAEDQLRKQVEAFDHWKSDLIEAIKDYQKWLDRNELGGPDVDLRIYDTLESLRKDHLTIAFVAEFSRGKTELINAIFFADFQRRLLPSEAGRTTMCPTELFYDQDEKGAYIKLLPIETRLQETSLAEFKLDKMQWVSTALDTNDPEQVAEALKQVIRTKRVTLDEAKKLGMYNEEWLTQEERKNPPDHLEIPMWRHALISFPHPLLKQGLVILDTPGLNALGTEPELTVNMLPSAQAVLFILAADTGVTKSDLDVWQLYITGVRNSHPKGLLVVLNKTDTLWDELKGEPAIQASIKQQCDTTAETLKIDADSIFPLSAHKGLLGKIRDDHELLQRSQLLTLENHIAESVLPDKQRIVQESVAGEIGGMVNESRQTVETRINNTRKQLEELHAISGKNSEVIAHLMSKTRDEQADYLKNVENFQASRRILARQAKSLLDTLSVDSLDTLIAETRQEMVDSWTTVGMKKGMKTLFEGAHDTMERAGEQAEQTRRLIMSIYKKFNEEHGLPVGNPKMFSVSRYKGDLDKLYEEAEVFRNSPVTTLTEQSFVVKKFFISLVSHARNLFFKANQQADNWLKEVMNPLVNQIKEHKASMEKRLETLRKINESRETVEAKISELEAHLKELVQQYEELSQLLVTFQPPE